MEKEFKLEGEYIELYKLLKRLNLASTGGHGKLMIEEGVVMLNNEVEYRKRAKIRKGDKVNCEGITISIV
jgi:ribosome-associated protein